MINDSSKAITAEDVIRRYNLEGLKTDRKVMKQVTTTIENQYTIIKNFVINLAPYTNQTDTTVWFSNGVPNLNDPLFDNIDTNKVNICYDRDNGVAYKLENNSWVVINDNTLLQSLAIASAEPDAEDKKRNVFYNQPTPPYAVGDLWLDGDTIMRCRCSRDGDDFNNAEWVTQENYSSVNVLLDVRAVLDSFIEEVYDDYATKVLLETSVDGINAEVSKKVGKTEIISSINQTAEQITINANKINLNGVVTANNNFKILNDGSMEAKNANLTGYVKATSGEIGGCSISNGSLQIPAAKITSGTINSARIPNLSADKITSGSIKSSNYVANTSGTKIDLSTGAIDSKNFKVDSAGNITSTGGSIGGWNIGSNGLTKNSFYVNNEGVSNVYTMSDILICRAILLGVIPTPDANTPEFKHYDINNDGVIDSIDLLRIRNLLNK